MNPRLAELRRRFESCCASLGVPAIFRTSPADDGSSHVEIVGNVYHYVSSERGQELRRRIAPDENEILYWLVSDVVSNLAWNYAKHHSVESQDSRRIVFDREIELMQKINIEWESRKRLEIIEILMKAPYTDEISG